MKIARKLFVLTFTLIALGLPVCTLAQIKISYGPDPLQYGELSLPAGAGPFPVVTLLHGGCWRSSERMIENYRVMSKAMNEHGIATWNLQYRGATNPGGGWPGTWQDLGNGFDALKEIGESYPVDLQQAVVVGHSSGGHFGAWLAMRSQLPPNSEIYVEPQVSPVALVITDAYINPLMIDSIGETGEIYCGEPLLEKTRWWLGGRQYRQFPANLSFGVAALGHPPKSMFVSTYRYPVSLPRVLAQGKTSMRTPPDYPALAVIAGDEINVRLISNESHGAFYTQGSRGYNATISAVLRLLGKATE